MSIREQIRTGVLAVVAGLAPVHAGIGQQRTSVPKQPVPGAVVKIDRQTVVREVDDPHCGARWILVYATDLPAGPGHWLVDPAEPASASVSRDSQRQELSLIPVIKAGDRIQVEEHTPVVDAVFEAIALGNATTGASLRVRLKVGEHIVRAIALRPGRAQLAPGEEKRP